MSEPHRLAKRSFPALGLAGMLVVACIVTPVEPCGCSPMEPGIEIINYDRVQADSAAFALDTLHAKLNDSLDGYYYENTYSEPPRYFIGTPGFGTLSVLLVKDSATKARTTFAVTDYNRQYDIIWTGTVDSLGYTTVQVVERIALYAKHP